MKKFCVYLREHILKMIDFKKKNIKLLTKEEQESYENAKICCICEEELKNKYLKHKNHGKDRDHFHYGEPRSAGHSLCNLRYSVPKKIPIIFHNGSNFDYHFIIKKLEETF